MEANERYFETLSSILGRDRWSLPSAYTASARYREPVAIARWTPEPGEGQSKTRKEDAAVASPGILSAQTQISKLGNRISALRTEYACARTDASILEEKLAREPENLAIRDRLKAAHKWMDQVTRQGKRLSDDQQRLIEFVRSQRLPVEGE